MSEQQLVNLPTGKPNISFSELKDWRECSYRHKLKNVDKISLGKPSPIPDFGTACHAACENFLKTRKMDADVAVKKLRELWDVNKHVEPIEQFINEAKAILAEVPKFFDDTFPGWQTIDAEHMLYEKIDDKPHVFKGYIDCIISAPGKKGNVVWIIDFKTTAVGWFRYKRQDDTVKSQLVLYKNFWSVKTGTDPKDVRCGFVLLKRSAKPGQHCELFSVSVGDVTTKRTLKVVNNMLASVTRGVAIKNRSACTYCDYHNTPHCT